MLSGNDCIGVQHRHLGLGVDGSQGESGCGIDDVDMTERSPAARKELPYRDCMFWTRKRRAKKEEGRSNRYDTAPKTKS